MITENHKEHRAVLTEGMLREVVLEQQLTDSGPIHTERERHATSDIVYHLPLDCVSNPI